MGKIKFSNRASHSRILKQMPAEVRKQALADLNQGGEDITNTMEAIVPVVKGDLKATIRHFNVSTSYMLRHKIKAGGQGAPYARRVEFTPGSAFFWPAYRANKRRVKGRITRGIRKAQNGVIARNRRG